MVEKTNSTETKKKFQEKLKQVRWKEVAIEYTGLCLRGILTGITCAMGAEVYGQIRARSLAKNTGNVVDISKAKVA